MKEIDSHVLWNTPIYGWKRMTDLPKLDLGGYRINIKKGKGRCTAHGLTDHIQKTQTTIMDSESTSTPTCSGPK